MYKVIGSVKNRTLRVLWTLEELGLEYAHIPAAPGSSEAMEYTKTGKVPAIVVEDQVFTDSIAIIRFLSDRHGSLTFPAGSVERLRMDGHIEFLNEEFDALLWTAAKNSYINPADHRCPDIKPVVRWEFERSLHRFETRLGDGPFLMGDQFTIADIVAVHCLNWAFVAKFPAATDRVKAYSKAARSRPAYARVMAI